MLNNAINLAEKGIVVDKYLKAFFEGKIYKKLIKNNNHLSDIYGNKKIIKLD